MRPKALRDNVVEVAGGGAVFGPYKLLYLNEGYRFFDDVPDGNSTIAIRMDRKAQVARLALTKTSGRWYSPRHWWQRLCRWWNRITRRWVELPVAEIVCQGGQVVELRDTRAYCEYHSGDGLDIHSQLRTCRDDYYEVQA